MYRGLPNVINNSDYRIRITNHIANELDNKEFACRSKDGKKNVFIRQRKLTFKHLVLFIMGIQSAIQHESDEDQKATFHFNVLNSTYDFSLNYLELETGI